MAELARSNGSAHGRQLALFAAGMAVFYAAPCLLEQLALNHLGSWISIVVLGDLVGCLALVAVRDRRTGVALYAALAVCKSLLIAFSPISPYLLVWATNAVPAVAVCLRGQQIIARKMAEEPEPPEEY
jgi:hypothetical protein